MLILTIAVCFGYLAADVFHRKFFSRQKKDNLLSLAITIIMVTAMTALMNFFMKANVIMSFEIFLPILIGCCGGWGITKLIFKE